MLCPYDRPFIHEISIHFKLFSFSNVIIKVADFKAPTLTNTMLNQTFEQHFLISFEKKEKGSQEDKGKYNMRYS